MTVGNIATDGYGLNLIEKPNVATNGYGSGLPTGFFEGSVTGTPTSDEIIEAFFDELLVIDAEIEAVVNLEAATQTIELVGTPFAQMLMVGLANAAHVTESQLLAEALEDALNEALVMDDTVSHASPIVGDPSSDDTLSSSLDDDDGMIGDTDEQTGVK